MRNLRAKILAECQGGPGYEREEGIEGNRRDLEEIIVTNIKYCSDLILKTFNVNFHEQPISLGSLSHPSNSQN